MEATLRNIHLLTTESFILLFCLILIVLAKVFDEAKFQNFLQLFFSPKYLRIYGKEQNLTLNRFNILMFLVQVISFGLLLSITIKEFQVRTETRSIPIILFLMLFILFKFYTEKIIAHVFNITRFVEQFHFQKLSYRNLSALILLPFITLLIYSKLNTYVILSLTIFLFFFLNFTSLALTIKNHQKLVTNKLFYFILYLCTLEIAPYLIAIKLLILERI